MSFSVDEAVALFYPIASASPHLASSVSVSPEDDDAWVTSVCMQKAQLEMRSHRDITVWQSECQSPSSSLPVPQFPASEQAAPALSLKSSANVNICTSMASTEYLHQTVKEMFKDMPMSHDTIIATDDRSMVVTSDVHFTQMSTTPTSNAREELTGAGISMNSPEPEYDSNQGSPAPFSQEQSFDEGTEALRRSTSPGTTVAHTPWRLRNVRPWTNEEHERFVVALERFRTKETERTMADGKQSTGLGPGIADLIAMVVETRDAAQVRSHAQKYFQRMRREAEKAKKAAKTRKAA